MQNAYRMSKRKSVVNSSSHRRIDFRRQYQGFKRPPTGAQPQWYRRRGREFERILSALLEEEGLDPRLHYRLAGEEIDGSFVLGHRVFLLEAKWQKHPITASTLYEFKGKVDGKLVGTLGIFISMSGYSKDAVDALTVGKDLNVVLLDGADVDICMEKSAGFKVLLLHKLRLAAEKGLVYPRLSGRLVTEASIREALIWQRK